MSITHNITTNWNSAGTTISNVVSRSNESGVDLDVTVAGGSAPLTVVGGFTPSKLKSAYMVCDRDLTVKGNSNTTSSFTAIALKAGVPLAWDADAAYFTNPFTGVAITSFFLTLAAGADARFRLEALLAP